MIRWGTPIRASTSHIRAGETLSYNLNDSEVVLPFVTLPIIIGD